MANRLYVLFILVIAVLQFGCSYNTKNVEAFDNPDAESAKYPYLYTTNNTLFMSWISSDESTSALKYSRYSDNGWNSPKIIARDSSWFVNWADFPSIIANNNGPMAAHWLNKKPGGTYAYNINISMLDSSGSWSEPLIPHTDGTATEHGFVSMIPWDHNTILAVWLDGRRSANRSPDDYYDISKAMTLRGALITTNGEIKHTFLIDDSVCDCCQTSLAKTDNGAVVAYRNRTANEIRDIYVSRFDGDSWSEPTAVHQDGWKIGACPVNGPKLAAAGPNVLLAWHTGAGEKPTAKAAISTDYGTTFNKPIRLSNAASLGRVDAVIHNGKGYVSWMEKNPNNDKLANLQLASFGMQDSTFRVQTIDMLNSARKTGFPQMELLEHHLIFAWTTVDTTKTSIRTKRLALPE